MRLCWEIQWKNNPFQCEIPKLIHETYAHFVPGVNVSVCETVKDYGQSCVP